jgi:drug/metabolite transporter (DMT)-like permease
MTFALIATLTGPFLGVSLSLMATLYTSTGIAQTIMAMTPIFILLPSWYFFKQKVTPLEILGAIISVGGVALFFV